MAFTICKKVKWGNRGGTQYEAEAAWVGCLGRVLGFSVKKSFISDDFISIRSFRDGCSDS